MKKLLLALLGACAFSASADAQSLIVSGGPNINAPITISSATTTKVIAGSSVRQMSITEIAFVSGGAGNVTFEYGNGTNCASNTVALSGAMAVAAAEYQFGDGLGNVFLIPAGFDFCVVTTASATAQGFAEYNNFNGF
jgi:hypothetical protein